MSQHQVRIKLHAEHIVAKRRAQTVAVVIGQTGRGHGIEAAQIGHQRPGPFELRQAGVLAWINAAPDEVHQRVVANIIRIVERHGAQHFATGQKANFDRVVHASAAKHLDVAAIGATRKNPGGQPLAALVAVCIDKLVSVPAIAPVNTTAGPQKAAVDACRIAAEAELRYQHFAAIRHAVVVGVFQTPYVRRARHIKRPGVP